MSRNVNPLDMLLDYEAKGGKVLLWFCLKKCRGRVTWRKSGVLNIARCDDCGTESKPA